MQYSLLNYLPLFNSKIFFNFNHRLKHRPYPYAKSDFISLHIMNSRVRNKLIQFARTDSNPVTFQRLITEAELGLNVDISHEKAMLVEILTEISTQEHKQGRPLLSAMVQAKSNKGQGDAFYKLCEELGYGDWKELKKDKDFIEQHRTACREFWSNEENFEKYI